MRTSSALHFCTALCLLFGVATAASGSVADDPIPARLSVRLVKNWEPCPGPGPAQPSAAAQPARCPTLSVDFGATIPPSLLARITGPVAGSGKVWEVQSIEIESRKHSPLGVTDVKAPPQLTGLVILILDAATVPSRVDLSKHVLVLTYFGAARPVVISTTQEVAEEQPGALGDVDNADDADLYFAGKAKASKGASAAFSFEARLRRDWLVGDNEWGGVIEIAAEEQGNVDPDSITAGLSYQRVLSGSRRLSIAALPIGGEFSRDDPKTKGVISSADLTWTVLPTLADTIAVDLVIGADLGTNLANAVDREGSGFLARGKVGLQTYMRWDEQLGFESISINATWLVRLLGRAEVDPGRPVGDAPTLTKRARHRATADLTFEVSKRFGLAMQFRAGPLPPAFETVNRSLAASLVYKAAWLR